MEPGLLFRVIFFTIGGLSVCCSTASAAPDWCHGNACDSVQLSVNAECTTVTNISPNKAITMQWGLYDSVILKPNQPNTMMFQGQCVSPILEAFNANFTTRAPAPAPAASAQYAPVPAQPPSQWSPADAEARDIMLKTCLISMPVFVVWVDPDGSLQGPVKAWANPAWPQGAAIKTPVTGATASTRYRTAWVYAETEQGTIVGGELADQSAGRIFRFSEDLQRENHLPQSSRFAAVHLNDAQWLGDMDDAYVYKAWRAELTCPSVH